MARLNIKKYPNPVLKEKAKELEKVDGEIRKLAEDMKETMEKKDGVGLAAPQVGISKQIIVVQGEDGPEVFINPKIIRKSRKGEVLEEGCLSLPGLFLKISRAKEVEVEAFNLAGKKVHIRARGLIARVFQHEFDHLNGILIINRIPFWQKWGIKKKLKEYGLNR